MRLAFALVLSLSAASLAQPAHAQSGFYTAPPDEIAAGKPGSLIRTEPMQGAPGNARAYRILYRSVGLDGKPIAVSGVAVIPAGTAPQGGRPVVAWAHPTSGVQPQCAPSLSGGAFQTVQGLGDMLSRGYIVTATDYPGLGTPGPHPYLVGANAGRWSSSPSGPSSSFLRPAPAAASPSGAIRRAATPRSSQGCSPGASRPS